jgi:tetratricopeptide (TPR) repeat protein
MLLRIELILPGEWDHPAEPMADLFPKTPKAIENRIRRYERALRKELKEGYGSDGYGKRYLRGSLYMLLDDVDGALASYDWYEQSYPDDSGDPYQYLTWALALYRGSLRHEAVNKLYQTMLENLYLVPHLLGHNPQPLDVWHSSDLEWIEYALEIPQELIDLWDEQALRWAQEVSEHPEVVEKVTRCIEIHRELNTVRPGARRSALVDESYALRKHEIAIF